MDSRVERTAGGTIVVPQMNAVVLDRFGGVDELSSRRIPLPEVGGDDVLIRVEFAGVGSWDAVEREGDYDGAFGVASTFPYVLGWDAAGTVAAVGRNVTRFDVGERVYAATTPVPRGGFYAEYGVVEAEFVARVPDRVPTEQAGAMAWDVLTALSGLDLLGLRPDETLMVALVVGPVFPHEVVGFSGGNKYFFPGVASQEVIDVSHWLGALITSAEIIGTKGITPVRAMIDEAAALIPSRRLALCVVVESDTGALHAMTFGPPEDAWAAAADVSAQTHVRYLDEPVGRVVSIVPTRYDDLWTAAKGFYKVEPIVADGGEVILYAPHVRRTAAMHPEIDEIGYHCRDYFTTQWDRFSHLPWGVIAHSTHLRGAGSFDAVKGERCRVTVTLATGIPEEHTRKVNLNYLDPSAVEALKDEAFVVPEAGEVLFRLR